MALAIRWGNTTKATFELRECIEATGPGERTGVDVRALVWPSWSGLLGYSRDEQGDLGAELPARGAAVVLDMRVRRGGAHHQKFVVIRHRDDATRDTAFIGGIDLCHGRRDDANHGGDPQADRISEEYGDQPRWRDAQVAAREGVPSHSAGSGAIPA